MNDFRRFPIAKRCGVCYNEIKKCQKAENEVFLMIGLQLYTVRKLMKGDEDSKATLKRIKEIGYESVQPYGNIERLEGFVRAAIECDMPVLGVLTDLEVAEEFPERLFTLMEKVGAKDIGFSSNVKTGEAARDFAKRVNAFTKLAKARGFTVSYHNHSAEFIRTEEGVTVMDILISEFSGDVSLMPDTYWLQHGGIDVRAFIEKYKERISILHLKDMARTVEGQTFAALGEGNLNMRGIIETALASGIKTLVVEEDECADPISDIEKSYIYLKENRYV